MTTKHIFTVDPGDKNNGFCYAKYDTETKIADIRIMKIMDQDELIAIFKVMWGIKQKTPDQDIVLVAENFRIDTKIRNAKFQWNEMEVIRVLGMVKLLASLLECTLVFQEASILGIRRKSVPFKVNKGHLSDEHAAYMHLAEYLLKRRMIMTEDQITFFGQEAL